MSWLAPILKAADASKLRLYLAGTRFDFKYLPRVVSAFMASLVVPLYLWRTFKYYSEDDVFARLRPVLSLPDKDLRSLANLVQGRSRGWVSVLATIIAAPSCTLAALRASVLKEAVQYLRQELSVLLDTDSSFHESLINCYIQLLFNRRQNNELRIPFLSKHGGVFFIPLSVNSYTPLSAAQVKAGMYLPGMRDGPEVCCAFPFPSANKLCAVASHCPNGAVALPCDSRDSP